MDLTLLVNEYFYSKKTSGVWKVQTVDVLHDIVECIEISPVINQVSKKIDYIRFKERFESGACDFIDGDSYSNWGTTVRKDYSALFNKIEGSFAKTSPNSNGTNPLWNHQYMVNDAANRIYGDFKTEYKKPNCECGAHSVGVKDYQGGHAHYCPVHKS